MTDINLRDYYPDSYSADTIISVPDEVAAAMWQQDRLEATQRRVAYYHKAKFSLDREDGLENSALIVDRTPAQIVEDKIASQLLHKALSAMPSCHARRMYAYFFLDMSKVEIARTEGISEKTVRRSIEKGLKMMKSFLENHA